MGDGGSDGETVANLGNHLGAGEPWQALFSELRGVKAEVLVENARLVESLAVLVEKLLRQEREALAIPDIVVVYHTKGDPGSFVSMQRKVNKTVLTCRTPYPCTATAGLRVE